VDSKLPNALRRNVARMMTNLLATTFASALMASTALAGEIQIRNVTFQNEGATLAGTLYLPADFRVGDPAYDCGGHRRLDLGSGADATGIRGGNG
jgi:hypothetical protein